MKKLLIVLLVIALMFCSAFFLVACGDNGNLVIPDDITKTDPQIVADDELSSSGDEQTPSINESQTTNDIQQSNDGAQSSAGEQSLSSNDTQTTDGGQTSTDGENSSDSDGSTTPPTVEIKYTVIFDANGGVFFDGSATFSVKAERGAKISLPETPRKSNYIFSGWYADSGLSTLWNFDSDVVSDDITLYVDWKSNEELLDDYYYTGNSEVGYTITSVKNQNITEVIIPDNVTRIARFAFFTSHDLNSIIVQEGNPVYRSENNCLIEKGSNTLILGCKTSVIPTSVTSIGDSAFSGRTGLTSITIPESVTSIGDCAFSGCSGLTSITIPKSVRNWWLDAFSNCSGLTSVIISDGVTKIGSTAFKNCAALTSITIPDSVTSIGSGAFSNSGLTAITIPSRVTSIGSSAFENCTSLTSITIPTRLTIGAHAFYGCSGIKTIKGDAYETAAIARLCGSPAYSVEITSGSSIDSYAFTKGLNSIIISDSVSSIGAEAFLNCNSLTSISIPDSVTSIGEYAFRDCTDLSSITVEKGNYVYHSSGNCLIETGTKTLIAGCKNSVIPSDGSVTSIEGWAFYCRVGLTSITIPSSVTSIGNSAFSGCSGLTSINYQGTTAQWNAISKWSDWNYNTGKYKICCTDGEIAK